MKNKITIPKGNKFTIPGDIKRQSAIAMDMIQTGKTTSKVIPDLKKKTDKQSCRGKKNLEE